MISDLNHQLKMPYEKGIVFRVSISTDCLRWFLRRIFDEIFLTNLLRVYWESKQYAMKNYDIRSFFRLKRKNKKAL